MKAGKGRSTDGRTPRAGSSRTAWLSMRNTSIAASRCFAPSASIFHFTAHRLLLNLPTTPRNCRADFVSARRCGKKSRSPYFLRGCDTGRPVPMRTFWMRAILSSTFCRRMKTCFETTPARSYLNFSEWVSSETSFFLDSTPSSRGCRRHTSMPSKYGRRRSCVSDIETSSRRTVWLTSTTTGRRCRRCSISLSGSR